MMNVLQHIYKNQSMYSDLPKNAIKLIKDNYSVNAVKKKLSTVIKNLEEHSKKLNVKY